MDIKEGDLLVVDGKKYPIKSCAGWIAAGRRSMMFTRLAKITAKTERAKKGDPETVLTGLKCTPLDPVDPDLRRRLALETPHELLQTFLMDATGFVHLVIEDIKR